jgi:hypothetical protein
MRTAEIFRAVKSGQRPPAPAERCPEGWRELVLTCWAQNPTKRPPISEVCAALARITIQCSSEVEGRATTDHATEHAWSESDPPHRLTAPSEERLPREGSGSRSSTSSPGIQ